MIVFASSSEMDSLTALYKQLKNCHPQTTQEYPLEISSALTNSGMAIYSASFSPGE